MSVKCPACGFESSAEAATCDLCREQERIPVVPRWFRAMAWLFLGAWALTGLILGGILWLRHRP